MNTITASVPITPDMASRYEALARATGQSSDALMADALRAYLDKDDADQARVTASIAAADRGEFASDEEIEAIFARYGGVPEERATQRAAFERRARAAHGLSECE